MRTVWLFLIGALFFQIAVPQTNAPKRLLQVMHCAEANDLLPPSPEKNSVLKVSWAVNVDRDPDMRTEYFVVVYRSALEGDVLVYGPANENGRLNLYLQNNASFQGTAGHFRFTGDPLGGVWTQEHLTKNLNRALRRRTYVIRRDTLAGYSDVSCHFYSSSK